MSFCENWKNFFDDEAQVKQLSEINERLGAIYEQTTVFPPKDEIFNAFVLTPFNDIKVVILGQDPYHGENQAHGLAFSVKEGNPKPPSLVNIFKELASDLGVVNDKTDLSKWAHSGVLLLNTTLTVSKGEANSHKSVGWEAFTDCVLKKISDDRSDVVFILWGSHAIKKAKFLDAKKHLIITSPHPSPLSSYRGFFDSKPFSKANEYLVKQGLIPIDWKL